MSRLCFVLLSILAVGCKTSHDNLQIQTVKKETILKANDDPNWLLPSQKISGYQYTHLATKVYLTARNVIDTVDILTGDFDPERNFWTTNFETYRTANHTLSKSDQLGKIYDFTNSMWNQIQHTAYALPIKSDLANFPTGIVPDTDLSVPYGYGRLGLEAGKTDFSLNTAFVLATILEDLLATPADEQGKKLKSAYGFSNPIIFNVPDKEKQLLVGFFGQKNGVAVVGLVDEKILLQQDFSVPLLTGVSLNFQVPGKVAASVGQRAASIWQWLLQSPDFASLFTGKRVWFAGLGTGGAVAALLGIYHAQAGGESLVYEFGAPRFADADFAAAFQTGKIPNVSIYPVYNETDQIIFYPPAAPIADIMASYIDPLVQR